jgi:hypothetical protein
MPNYFPKDRLPIAAFGLFVVAALGCSDSNSGDFHKAEYAPSLKIEIDPGATTINWARYWSRPSLRLFVRNSRDEAFQMILPQTEGKSVFFVSTLPRLRPGDEIAVEVWDDQTTTAEQQDRQARLLAAGTRLVIRAIGNRRYAVADDLVAAPEIDIAAKCVASWDANAWAYLGRGVAKVGNNGLPTMTFANPVTIQSDNGRREVIGRMFLFTDDTK